MSAEGCLKFLGPIGKLIAVIDKSKAPTQVTQDPFGQLDEVFQKVASDRKSVIGDLNEETDKIEFH